MMMLNDLPRVRLGGPKRLPLDGAWGDATPVERNVRLGDLEFGEAPAILVVEQDVAVSNGAGCVEVEDPLMHAQGAALYPAQSRVSADFCCPGVWFIPRPFAGSHPDAHFPDIAPAFVVPRGVGTFFGNTTPEDAFRTGFLLAQTPRIGAPRDPLALSIGADALNGVWWLLGGMAGLLNEDPLHVAWARHQTLLKGPDDVQAVVASEARRLRQEKGIKTRALPPDASRIARAVMPTCPGPAIWDDFIERCRLSGDAFQTLAEHYSAAKERAFWC